MLLTTPHSPGYVVNKAKPFFSIFNLPKRAVAILSLFITLIIIKFLDSSPDSVQYIDCNSLVKNAGFLYF